MVIIVPARGGSKRVPRKNLLPLAGQPLLARLLTAIGDSGVNVPVAVSTDDEEIARVAAEHRARVIDRPPALAVDTASTEAALLHALDVLEKDGVTADWVMTLQATSPFLTGAVIREFTDEIARAPDAQDCLLSVTEDRGDYWLMEEGGRIRRLFPDAPRRQQDRRPVYLENSAIYVTRTSSLRATGSIIKGRVRGRPIDPIIGFDINTEADFEIAKAIVTTRCALPKPS
jgi:CMP-N-acetylneuraminic acid synthetase